MMTDREMLELAAKAAGIEIIHHLQKERDEIGYGDKGLWTSSNGSCWNPLTDDGDALRMAVKLKIDLLFNDTSVETWSANNWFYGEDFGDDPISATRRIIVFAAAQIGEQM